MIKTDFFLSYLTKEVDDTVLKSILDNDEDANVDFTFSSRDDYWNKSQIKDAYKVGDKYNKAKFDEDYDKVAGQLTNYEIQKGVKRLASGGTVEGDPPTGSFATNNPVYMYNTTGGSPYQSYGLAGLDTEVDLRKTKTLDELSTLFQGVLIPDGKVRQRTTLENLGINNLKIVGLNNSGLAVPAEFNKGEDATESTWRGSLTDSDYLALGKKDLNAFNEDTSVHQFDKYGKTLGLLGFMGIQHKDTQREGVIQNTVGFFGDMIKYGALNTLFGAGRAASEIVQGLNAFGKSDKVDEINNYVNNALSNLKFKPNEDLTKSGAFDSWQGFSYQAASTIGQIGSAVLLSRLGVPPKATMVALTLAGAEGVQDAAQQMGLDKKTSALVMLGAAGLLFKTNQATEYIWGKFSKTEKELTLNLFRKNISKEMLASSKRVFDSPIEVGTNLGKGFVKAMKTVATSHAAKGAIEETTQETLEQLVDLGGTALAYHLNDIGNYFGMDLSDGYVTGSVLDAGAKTYNKRFSASNLLEELGTSAFFGGLGGAAGGALADLVSTKDKDDLRSLVGILNKDGSGKFLENARTYANVLKSMRDNGELFSSNLQLNSTGEALAKLYPKVEGKPNTSSVNDLLYKKMTENLRQAVEIFTRTGLDKPDNFDYVDSGVFDDLKVGKLDELMQSDPINRKSTILKNGREQARTANAYVGTILDQLLDELTDLNNQKTKVESLGTKDITTGRKKNPSEVSQDDLQAYKDAILKGGETSIGLVSEKLAKKRKKQGLKVGQLISAPNLIRKKVRVEDSIEAKIASVLEQITDLQQGGMADKVIKDVILSSAVDNTGKLLLDYFATKNGGASPLQAFYNVDNTTRQFYNDYVKEQQKKLEDYQQSLVDNQLGLAEIERLRGEAVAKAQNITKPEVTAFFFDENKVPDYEAALAAGDTALAEQILADELDVPTYQDALTTYNGKSAGITQVVADINQRYDEEILKLVGEVPQPIETKQERDLIKQLYLNRIGGVPYRGNVSLVSTLDGIKREIELEAAKYAREGEEYTNAKKISNLIAEVKMRLAQAKLNSTAMQEANEVVSNNLDTLPVEEEDTQFYKNWAKKQGSTVIKQTDPTTKKTTNIDVNQQTNSDLGPEYVTQISKELADEIERELNAYLNGMNFNVNGKLLFTGLNDLYQKATNGQKAAETNMLREDVRYMDRKLKMVNSILDTLNSFDNKDDDLFNNLVDQLTGELGTLAGANGNYLELYSKTKAELRPLVDSLQDTVIRMENELQTKLSSKGLSAGNQFIKDTFGKVVDITDFMKDSNDGKDGLGNPLTISEASNTNFVYLTTVLNYSNGDFYPELGKSVKKNVPSYVQQDIIKQLVAFLDKENATLYDLNSDNQLKYSFYLTGRAGSGKTSTVANVALNIHYSTLNGGIAENPYKLADDTFTDLASNLKEQVMSYGKSDIWFNPATKKYTVRYRIPTIDNTDTQALIERIQKKYGNNNFTKKLKVGDYFIVVPSQKGNTILISEKGSFSGYHQVANVASKTSRSILALAQHEVQTQALVDSIGSEIAKKEADTKRIAGEKGADYLLRLLKNPGQDLKHLDVIVFDEATLLTEKELRDINTALKEYNETIRPKENVTDNNYSTLLRIVYAGDNLQDGVPGALKPNRIPTDNYWNDVQLSYNLFLPTSNYMSYNFRKGTKSGGDILDYYRDNSNVVDQGTGRGKLLTTEYALDNPAGVAAVNPANTKLIDEIIGKIPIRGKTAYIYNRNLKDTLVTELQTKYPGIQVLSDEKAQGLTFDYVIAAMELTPEQSKDSKTVNFSTRQLVNEHDLNSKAASVVGRHTRFVLLLTSDKDITSVDKHVTKEVEIYGSVNTATQRPAFLKSIAKWMKDKVEPEGASAQSTVPFDATQDFKDSFFVQTKSQLRNLTVTEGANGFVLGEPGTQLGIDDVNQLAPSTYPNKVYLEFDGNKNGRMHNVAINFSYQGQPYVYTTTNKVIKVDESKDFTVQDGQFGVDPEVYMVHPTDDTLWVQVQQNGPNYVVLDKDGKALPLDDTNFNPLPNLECFL